MSDDEGWEARMAERQRARAALQADEPSTYDRWFADCLAEVRANMTLGDMLARRNLPPFGCACPGIVWCCIRTAKVSGELHRGAHIVAKLLQSAVDREGE